MKNFLLFSLCMLLATINTFSQVNVSFTSMTNGGNTVSSGSSIAIPSGGAVSLNFTVKMTKSSSQVVNGYLYVYTKKTSDSYPVTRSGPIYITNGMWSGSTTVEYYSSQSLTLSATDFNSSGGTLYAEFMSDTNVAYKSSSWSITITPPPIANNSISGTQTIVSGTVAATLTGNTPTGGNGTYTYSWQRSTSGTWSTISGATGKDYSPGALTTTTSYRRIVASTGVSNSTSNTVTITVVSPSITNNIITGNQTIDEGTAPNTLTGSVPTGGNGSYTYQWQSKPYNLSWSNITGVTSRDYSPGVMTSTTSFRRIVNSGTASPSTSNEITITVLGYPGLTHNSIAFNGVSTVIGSIPSGGNGEYLYDYYLVADTGDGLEYNSGFTSNKDFVIPSGFLTLSVSYPVYISRTVRSLNNTSVSQTITIEIGVTDITNNVLSFDGVSFVTGSTPTGGPGGGYTYSWEWLDYDHIGTIAIPNTITGETGKDLSVSIDLTTWNEVDIHVRRIASSGTKVSYSEWVSVNVLPSNIPDISNNTITFDGTSFITGSTPTGGLDGHAYRWELSESATSIPSVLIGSTGKDLSVPIELTTDTARDPYIRRGVYSSNSIQQISYSNWVSVLVTESGGRKASISKGGETLPSEDSVEDSNTEIILFPNPTNGKVNFGITNSGDIRIIVYSTKMNEVNVFTGAVDGSKNIEWSIPSGFSKGIYFYKIMGTNKTLKTGKFIYQ